MNLSEIDLKMLKEFCLLIYQVQKEIDEDECHSLSCIKG
jgi:hypothetical protein